MEKKRKKWIDNNHFPIYAKKCTFSFVFVCLLFGSDVSFFVLLIDKTVYARYVYLIRIIFYVYKCSLRFSDEAKNPIAAAVILIRKLIFFSLNVTRNFPMYFMCIIK